MAKRTRHSTESDEDQRGVLSWSRLKVLLLAAVLVLLLRRAGGWWRTRGLRRGDEREQPQRVKALVGDGGVWGKLLGEGESGATGGQRAGGTASKKLAGTPYRPNSHY